MWFSHETEHLLWLRLKRSHLSHLLIGRGSFASLPTWLCVVSLSTFDSVTLSRVATNDWGGLGERLNKDICFQLYCHHHWQHLACELCRANGNGIGVFGGGRKEMLSQLNEGRFTQNNEGWTHGFTADVYLKRPGKYCFGTEGFICRYTYPLQPLAPTWGPELSLGSLLFLFFF